MDATDDRNPLDLADRLRMLEQKRWRGFYIGASSIIVLIGLAAIPINAVTGKYNIAISEFSDWVVMVIILYLSLKKRHPRLRIILFSTVLILYMALPLFSNSHVTIWFCVPVVGITLLYMVLGPSRWALIVPLITALIGGVFFARFTIGEQALPPGAQMNFYGLIMVVLVIGFINELTKNRYQQAVTEAAERLEELSCLDGLTRLHNRRSFDEAIGREWCRHGRSGLPISLIMCDIDHFKKYNDSAGHQTGDECLREVAGAIRGAAGRDADFPARYGGEEFVILLPESGAEAALEVAGRLRAGLADRALPHPAFENGLVTLSIGVAAMVPDQSNEPKDLIEAADRGVYRSKDKGRDRISAGG